MIDAGMVQRCAWCMETETTIARRAFAIERLMDENAALHRRNLQLTEVSMARKTSTPRKEWPEVLTQAEAAEFLRCSAQTVHRLTLVGALRPYRIGLRPRYPLEMLRRYVLEASDGNHATTA